MRPKPTALGPISYLIVEFPGSKMTGEGFPILVDLVDQGVIRSRPGICHRGMDGSIKPSRWRISIATVGSDLAIFEGVSSGLIDHSDIADPPQ